MYATFLSFLFIFIFFLGYKMMPLWYGKFTKYRKEIKICHPELMTVNPELMTDAFLWSVIPQALFLPASSYFLKESEG